ncbi:MAG: hypothetical protein ACK40Z_14895, partial [Dietzia sp.]
MSQLRKAAVDTLVGEDDRREAEEMREHVAKLHHEDQDDVPVGPQPLPAARQELANMQVEYVACNAAAAAAALYPADDPMPC